MNVAHDMKRATAFDYYRTRGYDEAKAAELAKGFAHFARLLAQVAVEAEGTSDGP